MTAAELTKIEQKKAEKRERLLEAALALFAERGFHGTAVPLVAERAGISAGSVYRFFESKEALVNAVFREAKTRLAAALTGVDLNQPPKQAFDEFWGRMVQFARQHPTTFHFLELQDHAAYLDSESKALEMSVLTPIAEACLQLQGTGAFDPRVPVDVLLAIIWGAFVGLFKAERHGYLTLDEERVNQARDACFNAFAVR